MREEDDTTRPAGLQDPDEVASASAPGEAETEVDARSVARIDLVPGELAEDGDSSDFDESPVDYEKGPGLPEQTLLSRLESLVFVSPEPISARRLARIVGLESKQVRELLVKLTDDYKARGIILQEVSGGYQFRTHPDNAPIIRDIFKLKPLKLSRPALETLAIVAYRQPLTRSEAEQIRGVDCGAVLKFLFEKNLVRVIGRKEEPGRPIIYGTSQVFLELFGLKSLADLPALHEFTELWEEHQQLVDEEAPLPPQEAEGQMPGELAVEQLAQDGVSSVEGEMPGANIEEEKDSLIPDDLEQFGSSNEEDDEL